jgi:branched-chain amino acid transport system permease protein
MGPLADHWQLTLGIAIIVFVAWLPKGLIGLVKRISPKGEGAAS